MHAPARSSHCAPCRTWQVHVLGSRPRIPRWRPPMCANAASEEASPILPPGPVGNLSPQCGFSTSAYRAYSGVTEEIEARQARAHRRGWRAAFVRGIKVVGRGERSVMTSGSFVLRETPPALAVLTRLLPTAGRGSRSRLGVLQRQKDRDDFTSASRRRATKPTRNFLPPHIRRHIRRADP